MTGLAFVDIETTGLDPEIHVPWEIAVTLYDTDTATATAEYLWQVELTHGERLNADERGLEISGFHERYGGPPLIPNWSMASLLSDLLAGRHLVGNVISFDEERLRRLLGRHGFRPAWHYHIIDIEPMIVGYLAAQGFATPLPWKSDDLSRAIGVDPDQFDRHTASGDVDWALAEWRVLTPAT